MMESEKMQLRFLAVLLMIVMVIPAIGGCSAETEKKPLVEEEISPEPVVKSIDQASDVEITGSEVPSAEMTVAVDGLQPLEIARAYAQVLADGNPSDGSEFLTPELNAEPKLERKTEGPDERMTEMLKHSTFELASSNGNTAIVIWDVDWKAIGKDSDDSVAFIGFHFENRDGKWLIFDMEYGFPR